LHYESSANNENLRDIKSAPTIMNKEENIKNENEELKNSEENNEVTQEATAEETNGNEATEEAKEKDPLEEANDKIAELKDKYLRSVAEFDNYRKRTLKEKTELILNGAEKSVTAILPIIDDMERALQSAENSNDPNVLKEGMKLIFQKFTKTLGDLGVSKIETENADFDTDLHEAVALVPGMGDDKKGKVLDCVQTGYKLNDKVIRHAKVAVGQ
jgi:molecular chaperone GrpE